MKKGVKATTNKNKKSMVNKPETRRRRLSSYAWEFTLKKRKRVKRGYSGKTPNSHPPLLSTNNPLMSRGGSIFRKKRGKSPP